jgi:hypothetical protein
MTLKVVRTKGGQYVFTERLREEGETYQSSIGYACKDLKEAVQVVLAQAGMMVTHEREHGRHVELGVYKLLQELQSVMVNNIH